MDKNEKLIALRDTYCKMAYNLPANISNEFMSIKHEDKLIIATRNYKNNNINAELIIYDSNEDGIFESIDKFRQFLLDQIELYENNRNSYNLEEISKIRANI